MNLGIDGDTALVTASSSGLGKAAAATLVREGANVVINGRDRQRLASTVEELSEDAGAAVVGISGDLTNADHVDRLIERAVDEFGGLDHLVTNSGGPPPKLFVETTDEDWYEAYDLLVMSVVRLVRGSVDQLRANGGGTIVTVASRTVKEPVDRLVLSNAVRSAVPALAKTLSRELAPDIRVNAVLPGTHETARTRRVIERGIEEGRHADYQDGLVDWADTVPLGRIGDPTEFGDVVAYLCSARSSYVNGAALAVDGGETRSIL